MDGVILVSYYIFNFYYEINYNGYLFKINFYYFFFSFNPSGEMLAFSSVSRSEVRIAHFPSMSVFENFPLTGKSHKARTIAFSPGGGYMAMGGGDKARLFRLKHYEDY